MAPQTHTRRGEGTKARRSTGLGPAGDPWIQVEASSQPTQPDQAGQEEGLSFQKTATKQPEAAAATARWEQGHFETEIQLCGDGQKLSGHLWWRACVRAWMREEGVEPAEPVTRMER